LVVMMRGSLTSAGLFAGIGGIELGLERVGFSASLLCELDSAAQVVLRGRFPDVPIHSDVRALKKIPKVDVLSAGFPCQDLSQAGRTAGIRGTQSGLIDEVFRLVSNRATSPRWLLLENVSFMLRLNRGAAMEYVTSRLEQLGFRWAYRVLDSRAFGVPQRRQRVILLASRDDDPRPVLFNADVGEPARDPELATTFGFYWTEGLRGVGWAIDAVPTLKGGSTIGIPSPPAIWHVNDGRIVTPDVRDAERLQGFPADWTAEVGLDRKSAARRWKLVGNAVTVGVSEWIGNSILAGESGIYTDGASLHVGDTWPDAAWGEQGERRRVQVSAFPTDLPHPRLADFLEHVGSPLSARATAGFLSRARASTLHFREGFLTALDDHFERVTAQAQLAL